MRPNPLMANDDPEVVRELIRRNPWGTLVSATTNGMVASHYPILLDPDSSELAVFTHVGRPDDELHELGRHEILLIVQGPHGYISPSWYEPEAQRVPTWNFTVAHCYGVPRVLGFDENVETLTRLTAHFEQHVADPQWFDPEDGPRIAKGTVGLRIPISRFVCKLKMSQNKDPQTQANVLSELRGDGPYAHPALADDMDWVLGR